MKIKCPDCSQEYDLEKDCHIPLDRFTGKNIVKAAIRCKCGCPINIELSKPSVRSRLFSGRLGQLTVEVKKRGESIT